MRFLFAAALLAGAVAPALADTRDFPVGGFDRVSSAGPWNVRVHTGKGPSVHADGPKDVLDSLKIEVVGSELRIGTKPGNWSFHFGWGSHGKTVIDVTVPMVKAVNVSGPGDLTVDRVRTPHFGVRLSGPGDISIDAIDTQAIDVELNGPGDITLAGRAGRAAIRLSGPGDVRAKKLVVGDAELQLSGPGDVSLAAFGHVTGNASGPGDIHLTGKPHCDINKSGPGSVHCG